MVTYDRDLEIVTPAHPRSRRTAIIDIAGKALWLYLTAPNEYRPISDCWLVNLPPGKGEVEPQDYRPPPPAPASVLKDSFDAPHRPGDYFLEWSEDGEAVRALAGSRPIAFVTAYDKRGYHAHLLVDCPWGHPFDEELHLELFNND
jgi:hypothetical protein